mmetsp:Transcript_274/g.332  ORF Transcript_274/g.332 Transcript_274/m.332 type:complete len:2038 (+) Transcript_274:135-6248(+)|eukprot:CAMPEP_0119036644 /NCGR_PEP_ID=MMETSP1177-20130426/4503_1 /TAXON_ID=2985 /ORGANISM="Ochromonas sp, Strain CCMP1899" /LENGTH=2037 /DNA_ID=CAMNT_0006996823 /DNA_START=63 /DNA_END=6176 /DNA_ORIENTATION=+
MSLKKSNLLLCEPERVSIADDDALNLIEAHKSFDELEKEGDVVDNRVLEKCFRLILSRKSLKYNIDKSLYTRAVNIFHHTLLTKKLSFRMKSSILSHMFQICKKNNDLILNPIDYKTLWQDALDIASRLKKDQSLASETNIITYMAKLVEFLHGSRHYLIRDKSECDLLIKESMLKLQDMRQVFCIDGLLMMVNCLPTDYTGYAEFVPQWIETWSSISHNSQWDMCWLTLLTRARKHCVYDWKSLMPLLTSKAKELLDLPVAKGNSFHNHDFPFAFPRYYGKLLTPQVDSKKVSLNKLAKLMYFSVLEPLDAATSFVECHPLTITPPKNSDIEATFPGYNASADVLSSVEDIVLLFQSVRPFLYASNSGNWTNQLAYFITSFVSELGRHIGRSIAYKVLGELPVIGDLPSKYVAFERTLHLPTVKFLGGLFTVLSLEGLYGKNMGMSQYCASNLKNLCALDPSLSAIIMPFLLNALQPSAVNQAHQAPVAIHTINVIFKPLLYPIPLALKYLPSIMGLALPGLDPNDSMKTIVTLKLFSTILSWIPLKHSYNEKDSSYETPSYVSLVNAEGPLSGKDEFDMMAIRKEAGESLGALGRYLDEWTVGVMDKIFALLEAHEEPQRGKKGSMVDGGIGETVGYLFQAIDSAADPALFKLLQDKILDYFKQSTPINGVKVSAKIIESLVNANPSTLNVTLDSLLDSNVKEGACSIEKLGFRLRLAGGALRSSQGYAAKAENFEILKPFFSTVYTHHAEKAVRKSAYKLLKDFFKGSISLYPKGVRPVDAEMGSPIGAPNGFSKPQASWYIPTADTMAVSALVLETVVVQNLKDMEAMIEKLSDTSESGGDVLSFKKVEENLAYGMKVVQKCLRGSAEVLGDDYVINEKLNKSISSENMDVNDESNEDNYFLDLLIHSSRNELMKNISPENKQLFSSLRFTVLEFLSYLNESLSSLSVASPTGSMVLVSSAVETDTTNGASVSIGASSYGGLSDSPIIQGAWGKTFRVAVNSRMACLKAVDQVKSWFTSNKRMNRSIIVKTLIRSFKARDYVDDGDHTKVSQVDYWRGHDSNTNTVANSSWLQHAVRQKSYGMQINKVNLVHDTKGPLLMTLMKKLVGLCGHEYDLIRRTSLIMYVNLAAPFGKKSFTDIKPLFKSVCTPGYSFAEATGAFSLMAQDCNLKRITNKWEHTEQFLRALILCPGMIAKIPEHDKRQILMGKYASLFTKYIEKWHHFPLQESEGSSVAELYSLLLSTVGYDLNGKLLSEQPFVIVEEEETSMTSSNSGLRHGSFMAFLMLHFIGHNNVQVPTGVLAWAVQTVSTAHGQPTQNVALAALVRITYILCKQINPTLVTFPECPGSQPLLSPTSSDTVNFLRNAFISLPMNNSNMVALLQGISQSHPKGSESSAQWSSGIDHILRCSEYLKTLMPRRMTSARSEINLFSAHYRLCNSGLFMYLASLLTAPVTGTVTAPVGAMGLIASILEATDTLSNESEEEARANNTTKAEVFGGLLRGFLSLSSIKMQSSDESSRPHLLQEEYEMETCLVNYFVVNVEKLSVDYFSDWAEAVYFVFSSGLCKLVNPLTVFVLEGFRRVVRATDGAVGEESIVKESGEEGFARTGRALTLTRAALTGDINACACSLRSSKESPLGITLTHILSEKDSDFLSPFRNCRLEIGKLFSVLSENGDKKSVDLSAVLLKLHNSSLVQGSIDSVSTEISQVAIEDSAMEVDMVTVETPIPQASKIGYSTSKNAVETACAWAQFMSQNLPSWRTTSCLPSVTPPPSVTATDGNTPTGFASLLSIIICGSGHADIDLAKLAHDTCLLCMQSIKRYPAAGKVSTEDLLSITLNSILLQKAHLSFHVRETVMLCILILMTENYACLTTAEIKTIKDLYQDFLHDVKPEVVTLAKAGMISYLALKPPGDLKVLAEAYIKNSDILANRETKKRKLDKSALVTKPDKMHMTTVIMMSCLILALPYDLPDFMPALVTSLVRHATVPSLKETVTKTLQQFKMSHQDRWDSDFKDSFTREQLEDLQGAGAAHYFS